MNELKGMLKTLLIGCLIVGGAICFIMYKGNGYTYLPNKDKYTKPIELNEEEIAITEMYSETLSNKMTKESAKELETKIETYIAETEKKYNGDVTLHRFDVLKNDYKDNIKRHLEISLDLKEKAEKRRIEEEKKRIEEEKEFQENLVRFKKNCSQKGSNFDDSETVFRQLTKNQIKRMFLGKIEIGDPLCMVVGMPGVYKVDISKYRRGTVYHFYKRTFGPYSYVTVTNGFVDYTNK